MIRQCLRVILLVLVGSAARAQASDEALVPLVNAHSHNDYEHARPLLDALDQGFCSIEADIYLVDGQLLVAHDREKCRPERTLQKLYLDPLLERTKANGGRVYRNGPTVSLLIDVKTDAEATWAVLREVLKAYAPMLTVYRDHREQTGAVTVWISGNRAMKTMAGEGERYAACDGRPEDLDAKTPTDLAPLVSSAWATLFSWKGNGPLPDAEREKLLGLVEKAHAQGKRIRFWAIPDTPAGWREMRAAGVDLINTDHLRELKEFLVEGRVKGNEGRDPKE